MKCLPLLLISCSYAPEKFDNLTPAQARAYGVGVADGTPHTGIIVSSTFGTFGKMERVCGYPKGWLVAGCAIPATAPVWPDPQHEYHIYYSERCTAYHEAAHALFESHHHTGPYLLRSYRGDWLAACP